VREFTALEARQRLASLLDHASKDGAVRIRRKDGRAFVVRPEQPTLSPLDVPAIDAHLSREDILDAIREGRRPG
jgi:antitoxin Phd